MIFLQNVQDLIGEFRVGTVVKGQGYHGPAGVDHPLRSGGLLLVRLWIGLRFRGRGGVRVMFSIQNGVCLRAGGFFLLLGGGEAFLRSQSSLAGSCLGTCGAGGQG